MSFFDDINSYIEILTTYICLSGVILVILLISAWKIIYNQNMLYAEIKKINELLEPQSKGELKNGRDDECSNQGNNSSS